MGKFIITVSAENWIGDMYFDMRTHLDNASEETIGACIEIFKEIYGHYNLDDASLEVDILDVEKTYNEFKIDLTRDNEVKDIINRNKLRSKEMEKQEYELYLKLKEKFGNCS